MKTKTTKYNMVTTKLLIFLLAVKIHKGKLHLVASLLQGKRRLFIIKFKFFFQLYSVKSSIPLWDIIDILLYIIFEIYFHYF